MNKLSIKSVLYVYLILAITGTMISRIKFGIWHYGFHDLTVSNFLIDSIIGACIAFPIIFFSTISLKRYKWASEVEKIFTQILTPLPGWKIFIIAASSSIGEELFFRGGLQPILGLTITSLMFGLVHFPFKKILIPWTIIAIIMGFVFGSLVIWRDSLVSPIIAHFTINFVNILILNYRNKRSAI